MAEPFPDRSLFPVTRTCAYLNHASLAPMPAPVAEAIAAYVDQAQSTAPDLLFAGLIELESETRQQAASLVGAARADEVVHIPNTASGINIAARSLPLQSGDNVLLMEGDYPAVVYPWLDLASRGVSARFVPQRDGGLDLDVLAARIDNRTRAVCLSTAMYATGFRNDIAALGGLCRDRNLFLVVDAIQTLGALPMDVQEWGIDFLAAGSQKWQLCTPGTGLLYVRHDLLPRLQSGAYVGALSVVDPWNFADLNFTLAPTSDRFALTPWAPLQLVAMHAALGLLLRAGIDRIAERILALTDVALEQMEAQGYRSISSPRPESRSGIVVFEVPDPGEACERLQKAGVITSVRGGNLRLSPHFYNTEEEIARVAEVLAH